ncbi:Multiple EGF-like-domain protein 3 precursor [Labilithrix luteola]|uniref:Multiple EGF-like-domain protein 3 n=1 Tax=Labilithrix luteola TaxID=1391654 RepID=A0A0K1PZP4_9BACT|nr:DUF4215 domain-containing protein [Labilithrix luteola]AKU98851.1 Multiple EGF-like-domain protein 3 precursor [Labilithrix luteola]
MSRLRFSFGSLLAATITLGACAASTEDLATKSATDDPEADGGTTIVDPDSGSPSPQADAGWDSTDGTGNPDAGAVCGNGKLEKGEECDDGNTQSNDGCSATCKVESALEGDICPGATIALTAQGTNLHATVNGSTASAYNQYGSACGGGSGRDMVYTFTPPSSGKALVTLTAGFPAIISSRGTCDDATSEASCSDISAATGGTTTLEVPVFANTPVYFLVDGYGGSSGPFTLDIDVTTAVCGNGVAEAPESCDDGNLVGGDGCSAGCQLEEGGVLNNCPGEPFELTGPPGAVRKISFAGDTLVQGGTPALASVGCFYWAGNDVVYAIKSDVAGSVKADVVTGYSKANLHAKSDCYSSDYQLGCTQIEAPGAMSLEFPVNAGQWFYLFVDGHKESSKIYGGPYQLNVAITPSSCGNHLLDGNEQCDDGNTVAGDGCTADCKLETFADVDKCPGHPVPLNLQNDGTYTAVVSGTTKGMANDVKECGIYSSSGGDTVYAITPTTDGYLEGTLVGPFNSVLGVLKACTGTPAGAVATDILDCSYKASASTTPFGLIGLGSVMKTVATPVVANTTYYLFVESAVSSGLASGGSYELNVKVTPPTCGNGRIEGTETCDDGGRDPNDGCDADCHLEPITSRSTCNDAEAITLAPLGGGNYGASLARGTLNLLANGNFATSTLDACYALGKNAFFSVTAPAAGVLRATAKSTTFDVILGIRKPTCSLTGTPAMCANASTKGSEETLALPVAAGETIYIVVDGKDANESGRFNLDVSLVPPGCGDGFFTPTVDEECDDGNTISGDGCSATCKLEKTITGVDKCPGYTLALTGTGNTPRKGTVTFETTNLNADYVGACGGNAKDGVVRVVPNVAGTLKAQARSMANVTVYARSVCNDPTTEFAKSTYSTCTGVVHDTVTFGVSAGTEYFLFVDGLDGATGVPTLEVTVTP